MTNLLFTERTRTVEKPLDFHRDFPWIADMQNGVTYSMPQPKHEPTVWERSMMRKHREEVRELKAERWLDRIVYAAIGGGICTAVWFALTTLL